MKLIAGQYALKVAYRENGKQYGSSGGEADSGLYPFEETDVAVGEEFTLPENARLIFVREYTPCTQVDFNVYEGGA